MSRATIAGKTPATLADLAKYPGKAELIGGRIVAFMATGFRPGTACRSRGGDTGLAACH